MEGSLYKWTNYWKGWQLRYFVLKDGILYYYNNKDESNSGGCKRFFKISMFDIIVNKSDPTRVDLIIPNEQYLYLRALDYKERQKWLVALASQKATTGNLSNIVKHGASSSSSSNPNGAATPANDESNNSTLTGDSSIRPAGTYDLTYLLKIKQSELRLYCDLLSQQTHEIKNLILSLKTSSSNTLSVESNNLAESTSSFKSIINEANSDRQENGEVEEDDELFVDSNTSIAATAQNEKYQIVVDSENVKRMDELSSNLNITCDMLVTIIKNLIILSNTSTNVSSDAVQSLLKDLSLGHQYHDSLSNYLPNNSKSSNIQSTAATDNVPQTSKTVDESDLHLYHPMYSNQQLNQYKKTNKTPPSDTQSKMLNVSTTTTTTIRTYKSATARRPRMVDSDRLDYMRQIRSNYHQYLLLYKHLTPIRICRIESVAETQLTASSNEPDFLLDLDVNNNESHSTNQNPSEDSMFRKKQPKEKVAQATTTTETCIVATSVTDNEYTSVTVVAESHTYNSSPTILPPALLNEKVEFDSFFAKVRHRFFEIKLLDGNRIPSEPFLDCCAESFSILDTFGSTAFLPVKIDVYGNINKLRQKYATNPERFVTLQSIVQQEVDESLTQVKNSATDALMWLRRALWFICEFLKEFSKSTSTIPSECLYTAYHATVKRYHNWVVRGIFALALRAMPDKDTFIRSLLTDPSQYDDEQTRERLMQCIVNDVQVTMQGIELVIDIIKDFYVKNNLEV